MAVSRETITTYWCQTVGEYLGSVAREISRRPTSEEGTVLLWRGHGDSRWPLEPTLQREWRDDAAGLKRAEAQMFREFKRAAPYLLPSVTQNDWDTLSLAQHYGLPTRMLDWTVNHMIALWFALSRPSASDATVWAFRPRKVNLEQNRRGTHPFEVKRIIVFRPVAHSPRVTMQAAWHSVHKFDVKKGLLAIDQLGKHLPHLTRFNIPTKARTSMLLALERSGITVTTVFNDLPSLCTDIANRHANPRRDR